MTAQHTLVFLDSLYRNVDPNTGTALPKDSIFSSDRVRCALTDLLAAIRESQTKEPQVLITDQELLGLCDDLDLFDYKITRQQLIHIMRGSRRIANPHLKSLEIFGKYRSSYDKASISSYIEQFAHNYPERFSETLEERPKRPQKPWVHESFFDDGGFDKLDEEKAAELTNEVAEIEMRRSGDAVPEFIAKIRERYSRSFEPWTKAERALLLEAMCYTNSAERIGEILGRSPKAVTSEGKRLIYQSKLQHTGKK